MIHLRGCQRQGTGRNYYYVSRKYNSVLIYKPVHRQKPVNILEAYHHSTSFFYYYIYCPTLLKAKKKLCEGGRGGQLHK
jgi:hypothetical protein